MAYPTTFLTIQAQIFAKLRWKNNAANLAMLKDFINQRYAEVCVRTECLQTTGTMTLTAGAAAYVLDANVLRIKMIRGQAAGQTEWGGSLTEADLDELNALRQATSETGTVQRYALVGMNRLELHPAPTGADTLQITYVYLPTALTADGDIPELQEPWAKLLELGPSYDVALIQKDPDALLYKEDFERTLKLFQVHLSRRGGGPVQQLRLANRTPALALHPSADVW